MGERCVKGDETEDEARVQTQKRVNLCRRRRRRGYIDEYSRLVEQAFSEFAQGAVTTMVGCLICYKNHLSLEIPRIPKSGQDRERSPM